MFSYFRGANTTSVPTVTDTFNRPIFPRGTEASESIMTQLKTITEKNNEFLTFGAAPASVFSNAGVNASVVSGLTALSHFHIPLDNSMNSLAGMYYLCLLNQRNAE